MYCCKPKEDTSEPIFVPWKDAADKCLPEHCGSIAEMLDLLNAAPKAYVQKNIRLANDPAHQARRVSKQNADKVIHGACMYWESPFYVLAVGRGSPSGLRPDAVAGLLSLLVGTKSTNKQLTQTALLALARIFAGSKDELIAGRISSVWMDHENSDVRDDAMLTLALVGNADVLAFVETVRDLMRSSSFAGQANKLWHFCPDSKLLPKEKFDWNYAKDVLAGKVQGSKDSAPFFILVRLRLMSVTELADSVQAVELCEIVLKHVLLNRFSRRITYQAAITLLQSHPEVVEKVSQRMKADLMDAIADLHQMCTFREVRMQAGAYREAFQDSRVEVVQLLQSLQDTFDKVKIKASLLAKYPELESSDQGPIVVLQRDFRGDLHEYLRAGRALQGGLWTEAPGARAYPGIVGLFYVLIEVDDIPGEVITELLTRRQHLIRLVTLVHVCVAKRAAFWTQVVYMMIDDPIVDVRECADKVRQQLSMPLEAAMRTEEAQKVRIYADLIDRERRNLVLDMEFITQVDDASQVDSYLNDIINGLA